MQESRLFKIVYYLLDQGKATALELAEKLEVSTRTIYRDLDALSGAGIPVYTEAGRNGGIYLMHDFVLDRAVLSEEEKQEILAALQSVNTAKGMERNDIVQKLSALFRVSSENWLEVDFSRWGNEQADHQKFEQLKAAVIAHRSLRLTYADSYERITKRIVLPSFLFRRGENKGC